MLDAFTLQRQVQAYCVLSFLVACFFFVWAAINTASSFDLGVISFPTVMVSSLAGLLLPETFYLVLTPVGHAYVVMNYFLGAYSDPNANGFQIYCWLFTYIWGVAGVYSTLIAWRAWKAADAGGVGGYEKQPII